MKPARTGREKEILMTQLFTNGRRYLSMALGAALLAALLTSGAAGALMTETATEIQPDGWTQGVGFEIQPNGWVQRVGFEIQPNGWTQRVGFEIQPNGVTRRDQEAASISSPVK